MYKSSFRFFNRFSTRPDLPRKDEDKAEPIKNEKKSQSKKNRAARNSREFNELAKTMSRGLPKRLSVKNLSALIELPKGQPKIKCAKSKGNVVQQQQISKIIPIPPLLQLRDKIEETEQTERKKVERLSPRRFKGNK